MVQKKTNTFCISDLFIYLLTHTIIHLDFSDPMSSITELTIKEDITNYKMPNLEWTHIRFNFDLGDMLALQV